ncbi:heteromeric transposase endonuclease subunit TnsA [Wohlfahrtiimonas chitiniclastica]|uniref:Transposon Tn7 transposition protein tnsA n=4 Tax=Wohlfahrtiimonas chitiniclastica TaxID=400946 RepID=L8XYQ3_9GAMM|nr:MULTISPECIES: heteromeric transposase endonuclease subunit TnsA [Wohlfahrtiimonas]ELV07890.1 Transposon Tn7 transposition protein tnsA [Wohlfahrtiimonas chitiniclastica SH04]MBS7814579.1 heteromeric transposase endonuclease subunit TnsA [Wohlfahrtiimonas chitiniclastica]MBS7818259.1 heteromeric transposase endonuclease subunit TnsA [Wohlfahrtiimonas chitiniclastica]MBS7820470.1 heteromeric transposase endonuclease subunit TnsA [Wohlfahrtiimonas chitiniclastica]MBS7825490.1 heteromeric trans
MLSKNQEKWLKEGRGQGELADYKPWIKISDISSSGRSHRVFGHKTRRTHHLMSDLELAIFLFLEWNSKVIDIREQFPLKFDETIEIAEYIQVKHPAIGGNVHVMTSDFYVVSSDKKFSQLVLQAKYANELKKPRVIEKLEIERRYWNSKGIPWQIVTEKDIPKAIQNNIKWLYPEVREDRSFDAQGNLIFYANELAKYPDKKFIDLCKTIDTAYFHEAGKSLKELRTLLGLRFFTFDLRIDFRKLKCNDIQISNSHYWELISEELRYAANQ